MATVWRNGELFEHRSRRYDDLPAPPAAYADPLESDHHRNRDHPANRSNGNLWSDQQQSRWTRGHHDSDRDGGDVADGDQLREDGPGVSERGVGLHVCGARNSSRARVSDRLGYGDGLHPEPADLHGDLQQTYTKYSAGGSVLGSGYILRRFLHGTKPARCENFGPYQ